MSQSTEQPPAAESTGPRADRPSLAAVIGQAAGGLLVPVLAVVTAVVVGGLIIWLTGTGPPPEYIALTWPPFLVNTGLWRPILAYMGLIQGAIGSPEAIAETTVWAVPYIFAGLAVALAFKGGLFNIGAEGQLALGALATAWVGFGLPAITGPLPAIIHVPLALIGGMAAGALWGAIPGYLKARTGAHEVINTIMLNYLALLLTSYLLNGPWKDPNPFNVVAQSPQIAESSRLAPIFERLHWGLPLALLASVMVYILIWKTTLGFEIRTVGANPSAARYAGMNVGRLITLTMALSGLLAGMAGAVEVVALNYRHTVSFNVGYGFDAITIALLGRTHPAGVVAAAFLFGGMRNGATRMQFLTQVPVDIISVIQALILLFVAADGIVRWLYRIKRSETRLVLTRGWGGLTVSRTRYLFITLMILSLVAAAVVLGSGQAPPAIIAASFLATTLTVATPLTLGALSGIFSERAGVVNIAIEGLMLSAAFFGWLASIYASAAGLPLMAALLVGVLAAVITGGLFALLHAVLSITFKVDQIISGTVINILAIGLTGYLNRALFFQQEVPPAAGVLPRLRIPILADLPVVGPIFEQQPIAIMALVLVCLTTWIIWRTRWGLRMRAVGEHPLAADTLGINVFRVRYANVIIGGLIAGLGGAYFTLESVPSFEPGQTAGRGFIALAAMIFGNWTPIGAWSAALLFGAAQALQINAQYFGIGVPSQVVGALPYLLTMVALTGIVGRTTPPAADGKPYEK